MKDPQLSYIDSNLTGSLVDSPEKQVLKEVVVRQTIKVEKMRRKVSEDVLLDNFYV